MPTIAIVGLGLLWSFASAAVSPPRELITCGRDRVLIVDLDARDAAGSPKVLWTWQAAGRTDLPAEYASLFRSTDECKPVDGGRRILITSSSGGVALVERSTGAVAFAGRAVNAHSADFLPGSRIAVAASIDPKGNQGDALIVFDGRTSGRELFRTDLPHGHGVVWDAKRNRLWALSTDEVRSYALQDWSTPQPTLQQLTRTTLPEAGGHDLYPVPGTPLLSVTTTTRCWVFDRDSLTVAPHPMLAGRVSIKSITVHPITGQVAFTEAEQPNWWTTRIQFLRPDATVTLGTEQFYKVRWALPPE